jgi:hypothetical protein
MLVVFLNILRGDEHSLFVGFQISNFRFQGLLDGNPRMLKFEIFEILEILSVTKETIHYRLF